MYYFNALDKIKFINKSQLANDIGCSASYLNQVLNQRITCSKLLAYCITKKLDKDAEVADYFIIIDFYCSLIRK